MSISAGFYKDLSNEDYHASSAISKSGLMTFKRSPLHYYDAYLSDSRAQKEQTPQMLLGSIVHTMILEGDELNNRYVSAPKIDKRTNAGKEEWLRFSEENKNKQVVDASTWSDSMYMSERIFKNSKAMELIEGGINESSIFYNDIDTGLMCKSRPDVLFQSHVVDLKTTNDASPEAFSKSVYTYGYHIQCAMMQEAIHSQLGVMIKNFFFVCVETKAPFYTAIYILDDEAIHKGREEAKDLMEKYKTCKENNEWNGYEIMQISLPRWVR